MKFNASPINESRRAAHVIAACAIVAVASACSPSAEIANVEEGTLLHGQITSEDGTALVGIPVSARGDGKNFSVVVYSNQDGNYSFPAWSDLTAGSNTISIQLPDFEHVHRDAVPLNDQIPMQADFALVSREPSVEDASASEILAGLPGTDHEKMLFAQCSNCHTLQRALRFEYDQDGWEQIIHLMASRRRTSVDFHDSYTYGQQRFVEPLAQYLASIRGPGSSDQIPFTLRTRPTSEEATSLVLTEYDLPRGGEFDLNMVRGDMGSDDNHVWPHDVIVDDQYAYYTDHFSNALGRVDKNTGEAIEMAYPIPPGGGRETGMAAGEVRAGNPGGGSHDVAFDGHGNVIIGMGGATVRYKPDTEEFDHFTSGNSMFGLDPNNHLWHPGDDGVLVEINTATGERTEHTIAVNAGDYGIDTDSQGRTFINIWRGNQIGLFDPATAEYSTYEVPSPSSGPRRGEVDAEDNFWTALFYAGRVLRFDPDTGETKEYPVIPGSEPFDAPYVMPYSLSVDDKNGWVWTNDFNANRLHRIDIETGEATEFMMPSLYVMRDLTVEEGTERPTLWIPSYRPPSQIVKVQVR
jgi:streptogramin lyase